jgi:hypothetical protein
VLKIYLHFVNSSDVAVKSTAIQGLGISIIMFLTDFLTDFNSMFPVILKYRRCRCANAFNFFIHSKLLSSCRLDYLKKTSTLNVLELNFQYLGSHQPVIVCPDM